jgi:hypothetical protein
MAEERPLIFGRFYPILVGIPTGTRSAVYGSPWVTALGAAFCPGGPATIGGGATEQV